MKTLSQLKQYSRINKRRDVRYENIFRKMLLAAGIRYQRQWVIGYYIVDFIIKDRNLIVEIDEAHHANQKEADQKREAFLKSLGFKVLRVPYNSNFHLAIERIKKIKSTKGHRVSAIQRIANINGKRASEPLNIDSQKEYLKSKERHEEMNIEFRNIIGL